MMQSMRLQYMSGMHEVSIWVLAIAVNPYDGSSMCSGSSFQV